MKDPSTENMVVTLYLHNGWSMRRIARDLNLSRNCVRRILESNVTARQKQTEKPIPLKNQRPGKLESYKDLIAGLLEKYPKITGQRVYEHLIEAGYDGGITLCRGYLKSIRGVGTQNPIRMVETEPGQLAIHDWSDYILKFTEDGQEHKVTFFSYILAYSRRQYITVVQDKTQQTLFRSLIAAFIYMDGVPRQIRSDNQKACVDHWQPGNPVFNRKYLEFATWYRYVPKTITPRTPTENLKIERPFWYLEQNFLNGRDFKDEQDIKSKLQRWLTETNDLRIHATTKKRPIDMYKEEHPYLQGLPADHYDTAAVKYKVVNNESCIYWEGYQYVVPAKYMYELCAVRITATQMMIYSPEGEQIACHPLAEKGRKNRYVGYHSPPQKKSELVIADVIQRLEHFGPDMTEFIQLIKQHHPASWRHHLKHILSLRVNYREHDIMVAVRRAWEYKVFESGPIERFLDNNTESRYSIKLSFKPNNNDYE
jgi:transposase